uniref:BAR domain-containing protein n=1 Tax=Tetranychus urticae TaxID=32264 RepID=T1K864_TETUR
MSRFRNQESMMERITNLETHLREICYNLASYSRKIAKTRDEGDLLASSITKFAEEENVNSSLRYALTHFADCFSAIQDQRNTEEETRKGLLAKTKAGDIARSSSINEIHNAVKMYEFQIDRFEQRKLSDLKKYFKELIQIEMYFHAKSVEILTKAYKEMVDVDEKSDLNSFRNYFGIKRTQSPIKDNRLRGTKIGSSKMATSLRRFSSSPEVSSEKTQTSNVKSKSDSSESEDEDEITAEDYQNEVSIKK